MELLESAKRGNLEKVKECLANGANIESIDENGNTAFMWACFGDYFREESNYLSVAKFLFENGANINASNGSSTALHVAIQEDNREIAKFLIDNGIKLEVRDYEGKTPLVLAADFGQVEILRHIIKKGANIESRDNCSWTALIWSAFWGNIEAVKLLVENGANIEAKDKQGYTVLMAAVNGSGDDLEVVKYLVQNGVDIEAKDNEGKTALIEATERNNGEVAEYLIKCGANAK